MVKDPIQMTVAVTCGLFQIYFYENLFNPEEKSKIKNNKIWQKKIIETLLNELFTLDKEKNEQLMEQCTEGKEIKDKILP